MSKTIHASKVKEVANSYLKNKNLTDDQRNVIASFLEKILFETDNYNGFGYVEWLDEGGYERWLEGGQPKDNTSYLGNQTRKVYF